MVVRSFALPRGIERSLLGMLDAAATSLRRGKLPAARGVIRAFRWTVRVLSGRHIPPQHADTLTAQADELLHLLGG